METADAMGLQGLNITSPFKEEVIPYLAGVDPMAQAMGSVNTVVREGGSFRGYNTDHTGVRDALVRAGIDGAGKRAVVLGAGGAGKAAAFALTSMGAQVSLVNRTFAKAAAWAGDAGCLPLPLSKLDESVRKAHILVSCITSGELVIDPEALGEDLVVLDASYARESALVKDARARGCTVIGGREWLLFQGAAAFRLFTGRDAPVEAMRAALYGAPGGGRKSVGLIGFMGAGKSAVAARLATVTGRALLDTDRAVEEATGLAIRDIFTRFGEEEFRRLEEREAARVNNLSCGVVSFGGGAVTRDANIKTIRERCTTVWLWASPRTILKRIGGNGERPLLDGAGGKGGMEGLLLSRLPFYARASDIIINTDGLTVREVVERICHEIDIPL